MVIFLFLSIFLIAGFLVVIALDDVLDCGLAIFCCIFSCAIGFSVHSWAIETPTYYLEAEVLNVDETKNTTVFTTTQGLYFTEGIYLDDKPYLLSMDTMGTNKTADDTILVVWGV